MAINHHFFLFIAAALGLLVQPTLVLATELELPDANSELAIETPLGVVDTQEDAPSPAIEKLAKAEETFAAGDVKAAKRLCNTIIRNYPKSCLLYTSPSPRDA